MDANTRRGHDDQSGERGGTGGRGNRDSRGQGAEAESLLTEAFTQQKGSSEVVGTAGRRGT